MRRLPMSDAHNNQCFDTGPSDASMPLLVHWARVSCWTCSTVWSGVASGSDLLHESMIICLTAGWLALTVLPQPL